MGKKEKTKKEKVLEPEFYTSRVNTPVRNYKVYYMKPKEKIINYIIGFVVGALVAYLFYGGLFKDEYGNPTTTTYISNFVICIGIGVFTGKMFLPIRVKQIIKKRTKELNKQFRDMLEGLTTALGAGNNVPDAFNAIYQDLKVQYDEQAYILQELKVILSGIQNAIDIEDLLYDFGVRSGIDDIVSFADVFKVCYRKGGNIADVIRDTTSVLTEKMAIREEMETMVASNKTDTMMMVAMPVGIVGFMKLSSPDFAANFTTGMGVLSTTLGIICFVVAYFISDNLLNIEL